jgi:PAS domain S-box
VETTTLFTYALLSSIAINLGMSLVYWTRATYPGFGYWLAGSFCWTIGSILYLLPRDHLPLWLSVIAANYLFVAEKQLMVRGTLVFRGQPSGAWWAHLAIFASFCALFAYCLYVRPDGAARVVILSTYSFAIDIIMLHALLAHRPPYFGASDIAQSIVWSLLAALQLFHAIYAASSETQNVDINASSSIPVFIILSLKTGSMLVALTQIVMNAQRVDFAYRTAQAQLERELREHREAERRLDEERQRLDGIIRGTNAGTWELNESTGELAVNERWAQIIGYSASELSPVTLEIWKGLMHPEDRERFGELLGRHLRGEIDHFETDVRLRHRDGTWIWAIIRGKLVSWPEGGGPALTLGTELDITERKRDDMRIRQALLEKETLLRELYHRTKNNMQMIVAMMHIRAVERPNMTLGEFVEDISQKIGAMALVHQDLYERRDLSRIDLGAYLGELARLSLEGSGLSGRVSLDLDLRSLPVIVDTAIPVGLVVNELLSNALKHAFPGDRKGTIGLGLSANDNGLIELRIRDDGAGLPPGCGIEDRASYGLKLVNLIVREQIEGTISAELRGGTAYTILFKDGLYARSSA